MPDVIITVVPGITNSEVILVTEGGRTGPAGPAGPIGPAGESSEDTMIYAKRIDFVGNNIIYRGEALPGSSESASVWRIRRISLIDEDMSEEWASSGAFANAWTARTSLVYS